MTSLLNELPLRDSGGYNGSSETFISAAPNNHIERLRLLWGARNSLRGAAIAGLAVAALVAFILPAKYESTEQLMPPEAQSNSGTAMLAAIAARGGEAAESVSSDLLGLKSSGALFVSILNSRTVQERIIERFELRKRYHCRTEEDARRQLGGNTAASEERKSGIITITVTDTDPQVAAEMAGAYVDELNRMVTDLSTSAAHRERIFLEQRLIEVKRELDRAAHALSAFASENTALDIKEQARAMIDDASSLTGQLIAAESEEKGLEEIYSRNNVRVRSVQARITQLRNRLSELQGNNAPAPGAALDPNARLPNLKSLPLLGVTYSDLYRQSQIQETVYETLTREYELAKVQEAKETPSVKVLDTASLPERRSYPPRLQIMLAGITLGVAGASLWVLAKERWAGIDERDPAKQFVTEILQALHVHMLWAERIGSRWNDFTTQMRSRLRRNTRVRSQAPSRRN